MDRDRDRGDRQSKVFYKGLSIEDFQTPVLLVLDEGWPGDIPIKEEWTMTTATDADLQSLIRLCSLTGTKAEQEKDLDEFILRALRLAPSGLSDDSGDALHSLATTIGVRQAPMRLLLDGNVEAVRREDGEMEYVARSEAAESLAS